jgi:hypothetical protein
MRRRIWIRIVVWSMALVVVLIADHLYRGRDPGTAPLLGDDPAPAASIARRQATAAEWAAPLAVLGERRLARQVLYIHVTAAGTMPGADPRQAPAARGLLAHFFDPVKGESLAYLADPGELGPRLQPIDLWRNLYEDVCRGRTFLYPCSDADLTPARICELPVFYGLPPGWTLLDTPGG